MITPGVEMVAGGGLALPPLLLLELALALELATALLTAGALPFFRSWAICMHGKAQLHSCMQEQSKFTHLCH